MSGLVSFRHQFLWGAYHIVLPAEYRRVIFDDDVDEVLKDVCLDIENRYQIKFLEIGTDKDQVHLERRKPFRYSIAPRSRTAEFKPQAE